MQVQLRRRACACSSMAKARLGHGKCSSSHTHLRLAYSRYVRLGSWYNPSPLSHFSPSSPRPSWAAAASGPACSTEPSASPPCDAPSAELAPFWATAPVPSELLSAVPCSSPTPAVPTPSSFARPSLGAASAPWLPSHTPCPSSGFACPADPSSDPASPALYMVVPSLACPSPAPAPAAGCATMSGGQGGAGGW